MRQKSFEESLENLNQTDQASAKSATKANDNKQDPANKYDEDDAYDDDEQINEDFPQLISAKISQESSGHKLKAQDQRVGLRKILNLK